MSKSRRAANTEAFKAGQAGVWNALRAQGRIGAEGVMSDAQLVRALSQADHNEAAARAAGVPDYILSSMPQHKYWGVGVPAIRAMNRTKLPRDRVVRGLDDGNIAVPSEAAANAAAVRAGKGFSGGQLRAVCRRIQAAAGGALAELGTKVPTGPGAVAVQVNSDEALDAAANGSSAGILLVACGSTSRGVDRSGRRRAPCQPRMVAFGSTKHAQAVRGVNGARPTASDAIIAMTLASCGAGCRSAKTNRLATAGNAAVASVFVVYRLCFINATQSSAGALGRSLPALQHFDDPAAAFDMSTGRLSIPASSALSVAAKKHGKKRAKGSFAPIYPQVHGSCAPYAALGLTHKEKNGGCGPTRSLGRVAGVDQGELRALKARAPEDVRAWLEANDFAAAQRNSGKLFSAVNPAGVSGARAALARARASLAAEDEEGDF